MGIIELIAGPIFKIIDKLIPDPAAKAAMQVQILQMQQAGEFKEIDAQLQAQLAQTDINKVEAASGDKFAARWRPLIGYICGAGLGVQFLIAPFFTWITALIGHPTPFPTLDMGTLLTLLLGLLGLGSMRTAEKLQGKA
jgi:hypothetical protein